jgi:hypothetical protein
LECLYRRPFKIIRLYYCNKLETEHLLMMRDRLGWRIDIFFCSPL